MSGVAQLTVGFDALLQVIEREQLAQRRVECLAKALELVGADRQPGRGRMPAEAQQQAGMALVQQVQGVAQMQPRDGSAGALELAVVAGREGDDGTMEALAHAGGEDADHALVPGRVVQRQAPGRAWIDVFQVHQRAGLHVRFDAAALAIQLVQPLRELICARRRLRRAGIRSPASCR